MEGSDSGGRDGGELDKETSEDISDKSTELESAVEEPGGAVDGLGEGDGRLKDLEV